MKPKIIDLKPISKLTAQINPKINFQKLTNQTRNQQPPSQSSNKNQKLTIDQNFNLLIKNLKVCLNRMKIVETTKKKKKIKIVHAFV